MLNVLIVEADDRDAALLEGYLARYSQEKGVEIHTERHTPGAFVA